TQNKIIEQLETLIKGLSEKIYSQKIRFKKFTEKWEVKKLGEISTITTGSSNREDSILNGEYTFFDRSQDIRTSSRFLFDKEAVIVPGEGQEFIPKYFIGKFDLHQRTYAIFDFRGINGKYLYYHLLNDDKYLQSKAVGSTVKSLRLPMFQSMPIKSPCLDEQTTIANFLSVIETKIQIEKNILDKYHCQKQYLLQSLFI
ncbi:MAG TPA: restriction endonuclease subunit S, partial [Lactococcus lactis]|nr:restriction endonuclease subunit S [Lactococcus lactis]